MEKLIQQWTDDALNARDHNVSVPALVDKLFSTCHRTGGDAAVVQDECFACRSYRTERAEKAYQEQVGTVKQLQIDLIGTEENVKEVTDAAEVVQRQLKATQDELISTKQAYIKAAADANGLNDVAERRAIEVAEIKAHYADALASVADVVTALKAAQAEVARLTSLAQKMVK